MNMISKGVISEFGGLVKIEIVKEMVQENEQHFIQTTKTTSLCGLPVSSKTTMRKPGLRDAAENAWGPMGLIKP